MAVFKLLVDMYYCLAKLHVRFIFRDLNFQLLKGIGAFSFFVFLNMMTDTLNYSVDKFVLGMVKGTTNIAIYSVGASLNQYYISFSSAISTVFIPRVNRLISAGESNRTLSELFIRIGRLQYLVISLIFSGFVIFGRSFITIWAGNGYENAYYVALVIMLPTTVPLIQNISIEIQRAKNLHKFRSVTYLCIALGNFAISIQLAKFFGEIGSAVGTGIATTLGNIVIMNIYNYKVVGLDIPQFWKQIGRMTLPIVTVMLLGLVGVHFVNLKNYLTLLPCILVYCVLYAGILWMTVMNDSEKQLVQSMLGKFRKRT